MFWYEQKAENKDVVVSTRVRLARNLREYPFAARLSEEKASEIVSRLSLLYKDKEGYSLTDMRDISRIEAESLCERHYISREFAQSTAPRLLITEEKKNIAIMVGEEDHLRIQCLKNGLALDEAFEETMNQEKFLDSQLSFAYHESLGYLTHCPTNLGTGMRISVMIHLPALTMLGHMDVLRQQLQKLGVAVRGMQGEGSRADAALYQISNQVTMGITEAETLQKMKEIVTQMSERERAARASFNEETKEKLLDSAQRAEGILRSARMISSSEFLTLYNSARLGCTIGNTSALSCDLLDRLLFAVMPATMALAGYRDAESSLPKEMQRDKNRAILIQNAITARDRSVARKSKKASENA